MVLFPLGSHPCGKPHHSHPYRDTATPPVFPTPLHRVSSGPANWRSKPLFFRLFRMFADMQNQCPNVLLHFTPAAPSAYYTLSPQKQTKPTLPGPASTPKKAGASPIKKDTPETGSKSSRKVCTTHSPSPFHPLQALASLPQLTIPPTAMNSADPPGLPCYRTQTTTTKSKDTDEPSSPPYQELGMWRSSLPSPYPAWLPLLYPVHSSIVDEPPSTQPSAAQALETVRTYLKARLK